MTRFIDYAPMVFQRHALFQEPGGVFRKIRASFGIHSEDYLRSVGPEQLLGNMVLGNLSSLSELSSEGKSQGLTRARFKGCGVQAGPSSTTLPTGRLIGAGGRRICF